MIKDLLLCACFCCCAEEVSLSAGLVAVNCAAYPCLLLPCYLKLTHTGSQACYCNC